MKTDVQTARRNLHSPNIKTRKRALKLSNNIKEQSNTFLFLYIHLQEI